MATEQDWRNSSKYWLSPEQKSAVGMRSIDAQTTVCMEECAELIQAISKLKRFGPEDPNNMVSRTELIENLYEEMADMRRMMDYKLWRMKQKMEAQGEKF